MWLESIIIVYWKIGKSNFNKIKKINDNQKD